MQDVRGGKATVTALHSKTIRCVDVSPRDDNLLMTGDAPARARPAPRLFESSWLSLSSGVDTSRGVESGGGTGGGGTDVRRLTAAATGGGGD